MPVNPLERFSRRAAYYARYHPRCAAETLATLQTECGLTPDMVIADVGSGTGILSELFLQNGNRVFGIEPNQDMRTTAESLLADWVSNGAIASIYATAEATTLPDHSVDLIAAGQAFDWFDLVRTKIEFQRISKPGSLIVLVSNRYARDYADYIRAYGQIARTYCTTSTPSPPPDIAAFFGGAYEQRVFDNPQLETLTGIIGGLLSASSGPIPDSPEHRAMAAELAAWFATYQQDGHIRFECQTEIIWGKL
jgi:ubiquinone/menaquinone biosynthesis C-methylase UbiE